MSGPQPSRGEIWYADLSPTRGHEQAGHRPVLVVSVDEFNQSPADLVIVVPLTRRDRGLICHVEITPPHGGLEKRSFAMCENVRSISRQRLTRRLGIVSQQTIAQVEDRLRVLLGL